MAIDTGEILKKVRRIEIRTRRIVNDLISGEYHSSFKGQGMEFDEVREYMPGDDVRRIDWNVTARYGTPFIKKFAEERELTVIILMDVSGSKRFGTVDYYKSELAAELTALLAFAAIKNNDKVGMISFSDRIEKFIPPKKGRRNVLRLIREVLYSEPQSRGTDIGAALEYFNRVIKRRAVLFVISDFIGDDFRKPLMIASRKHDAIAINITDPRELRMPESGLMFLEDAETGKRMWVDTSSSATRRAFAEDARIRQESVAALFRQHKIDYVSLSTEGSYIEALTRFFKLRELKRHH
ncbi:MAG: DUF58 domain-containing protein [Candidatus Zixiibacteriota bacterium]